MQMNIYQWANLMDRCTNRSWFVDGNDGAQLLLLAAYCEAMTWKVA